MALHHHDEDSNIQSRVAASQNDIHSLEPCTTNAHDLEEASKLQERLAEYNKGSIGDAVENPCQKQPTADWEIPSVAIDEGAHKYVLISATPPHPPSSSPSLMMQRYSGKKSEEIPENRSFFVYSKRGASYHRNVAESLLPNLEASGYSDIRIKGGGRILRDDEDKKIHIFGYSYGFGQADHELAQKVVVDSGLFRGYALSWSNDGY